MLPGPLIVVLTYYQEALTHPNDHIAPRHIPTLSNCGHCAQTTQNQWLKMSCPVYPIGLEPISVRLI